MKVTALILTLLALRFPALATPSPKVPSKKLTVFNERERSALDFARDWNASKTMDLFLSKYVDPHVPRNQRAAFLRATQGYRWVVLPKVIPLKDALIFTDADHRTLLVSRLVNLRPLTTETNGQRQTFLSFTDIVKAAESASDLMPRVLRSPYGGRKSAWLDLLGRGLLPEAVAGSGIASVTLSLALLSLAINAHTMSERARRSAEDSDSDSSGGGEAKQAQTQYQNSLESWVRKNMEQGSCETNGNSGPSLTMKPQGLVRRTKFQESVVNDVATFTITTENTDTSYVIEKALIKVGDDPANHRVFADDAKSFRICRAGQCRSMTPERFYPEFRQAVVADNQAEVDTSVANVEPEVNALAQKLLELPSPSKINAIYHKYTTPADEAEYGRHKQERYNHEQTLAEVDKQIQDTLFELTGPPDGILNWIKSKTGYRPGINSNNVYSIEARIEAGHLDQDADPQEVAVIKQLKKSGILEKRQRELEASAQASKAANAIINRRNALARNDFLAAGLTETGDYPQGKNPREIVLQSSLCQGINWGPCQDFLASVQSSLSDPDPSQKTIDQFKNALRGRMKDAHDYAIRNGIAALADELSTSYAIAQCCDEKVCGGSLSQRLLSLSPANANPASLPETHR